MVPNFLCEILLAIFFTKMSRNAIRNVINKGGGHIWSFLDAAVKVVSTFSIFLHLFLRSDLTFFSLLFLAARIMSILNPNCPNKQKNVCVDMIYSSFKMRSLNCGPFPNSMYLITRFPKHHWISEETLDENRRQYWFEIMPCFYHYSPAYLLLSLIWELCTLMNSCLSWLPFELKALDNPDNLLVVSCNN